MGSGIVRVQFEGVPQKPSCDRNIPNRNHRKVGQSAQIKVISVEAFRSLAAGSFDLGLAKTRLDDADHSFSDLILQLENILQTAIELLGP